VNNDLRLATRIHFALLRQYGANVEIGALIKGGGDAREALWVCEASGNTELAAMARELKKGQQAARASAAARSAAAPQDNAWSGDTSGFGVSRPNELDPGSAGSSGPSWLKPSSWGKRSAPARRA
jgi:hypothetical protein